MATRSWGLPLGVQGRCACAILPNSSTSTPLDLGKTVLHRHVQSHRRSAEGLQDLPSDPPVALMGLSPPGRTSSGRRTWRYPVTVRCREQISTFPTCGSANPYSLTTSTGKGRRSSALGSTLMHPPP